RPRQLRGLRQHPDLSPRQGRVQLQHRVPEGEKSVLEVLSATAARRKSAFQFLTKYFTDKSRQDCCSGLGKRASAAIRHCESAIRSRVRLNASATSHLMKRSTISADTLMIVLGSLASIATALAEPRQLNPKEHSEKYDMPPAYIFRLESSPQMISRFGPFTSY